MRAQSLFRRAALAVACSAALAAQAQAPAKTPASGGERPPAVVNNSALDAQTFTQVLVAELESTSGQKGLAFQLMLDAARRTLDEGLFRRAVFIASEAREGDAALLAVQAWREAFPASVEPSRFELQVFLGLDRYQDAAAATKRMLDLTPPDEKAGTFASLPRLFARNKDRKQTAELLEPVLAPWIAAPDTRVSASVALARIQAAGGNLDRAIELVKAAHAHDPKADAPAIVALELVSATPAADAIIKSHLDVRPDAVPARLVYAQVLSDLHRHADAAAQLETVTRLEPGNPAPWLPLAALQLELKRPTDATATVQRYLAGVKNGSIVPAKPAATAATTPVLVTAGDADEAEDEPANDLSVSQSYFLLARAAEQQKKYAEADRWLLKVNDPKRGLDVAVRRAELLARQGKIKKAVELLRKAPEPSPESARTKLVQEAQLYSDAKQWATAERVLAGANQRFPDDAELLYQQAMMAEKLDRMQDMERLLRRAIAIRPDHHHAYNALGYSLADRNQRLPEARELIVKALDLAPGEPFITDSLGWVEYRLGNMSEAQRLLREAYRLRPDVEIGVHLAEVLWVAGERDEARTLLRAARQKEADNDVLRKTLTRLKVDL